MLIIGMILITSIVGLFYYRMDQIEEEERYNRCRKISRIIMDMHTSDVDEMRQRITFSEDTKGIALSPTIRDESYSIEIWIDLVRVKNKEGSSSKRLRENVHLWPPDEMNNTGILKEEERRWRDGKKPYLELEAGSSDLELTMLMLDNGSERTSHVFISEVAI